MTDQFAAMFCLINAIKDVKQLLPLAASQRIALNGRSVGTREPSGEYFPPLSFLLMSCIAVLDRCAFQLRLRDFHRLCRHTSESGVDRNPAYFQSRNNTISRSCFRAGV